MEENKIKWERWFLSEFYIFKNYFSWRFKIVEVWNIQIFFSLDFKSTMNNTQVKFQNDQANTFSFYQVLSKWASHRNFFVVYEIWYTLVHIETVPENGLIKE